MVATIVIAPGSSWNAKELYNSYYTCEYRKNCGNKFESWNKPITMLGDERSKPQAPT